MKNKIFILLFLPVCISLFSHAEENSSLYQKNNSQKMIPCSSLERKIVAYIDQSFFVKKCSLLPILQTDILNKLIIDNKYEVITISKKNFASMKLGKPYEYKEYYEDHPLQKKSLASICKEYENKIVTTDNLVFYLIENCKKRRFSSYMDMSAHKSVFSSIEPLDKYILSVIPTGKPVKPRSLPKIQEAFSSEKRVLSVSELCRLYNRKVVAFHTSFFFLNKCILHKITDFGIDVQMAAEKSGGILELSSSQIRQMQQGKDIKSAKVLPQIN